MAEPFLVALLFADRVIVEEKNKKKTIVGTFTRFYSDKFPVSFPPWYIYAAATNISGDHSFSLNLVLEKEMQVVVPINGKLKVENPRNVIELIFPIGQAIFPYALLNEYPYLRLDFYVVPLDDRNLRSIVPTNAMRLSIGVTENCQAWLSILKQQSATTTFQSFYWIARTNTVKG